MTDFSHLLTPPLLPKLQVRKGDPRLLSFLSKRDGGLKEPKAVLVGYPSSRGAEKNGGRAGAELAPTRIRSHLYSLTPDARFFDEHSSLLRGVLDIGDIRVGDSVEENQKILAEVLAPYLRASIPCVVLGGSHDVSYGHFLGYVASEMVISILNFDAHADVREFDENSGGHSGSPFRQALLHPSQLLGSYSVYGLNSWSVARSHLDFLVERNCQFCFSDEMDQAQIDALFHSLSKPTFLSLDIDGLSSAVAPGVSAPNGFGLSPELYYRAALRAGQSRFIQSFDVAEVNPTVDHDGATSRVAALCIWHFLRGMAE
ncbi:MAG: formimidoylglutamase [Bdellovibrionales bacterium]|nr:formimidoylglutamase [Bdellovibrionales bacterium]